ncbi:Transporter, major facilitator family protein [uncultured Eubacteriales bacterium]|uniref:Transporter, major facilitator family protein n=1 Tax=uncultured Eubacteriales bacterium TaxID=172733 RepID=A0A212KE03_9FIRM|nr:Transporter, major facilitator family protein [uncultured Eubacteriales bacterium]
MEHNLPSSRQLNWHYIAMQAGFWAMFASIVAFQTPLLQARGFTNTEVGFVVAVRCGAGIFCQPLLGGFADKHPNIPLKFIVSASLTLSLLVGLLFTFVPMGLWGTLAVFVVLGGFEISAYPLMDAMAIQYINAGVPIRYSLGRGIGSFSYAISCVVLGLQSDTAGVESTLLTHAALVVLVALLCITYPTFRAQPRQSGVQEEMPQSVVSLLRGNPRFTLMLVAILLGMTACLPMSNYMTNILLEKGGSNSDLGPTLFMMAAFELPTAFFFQRLLRRYGSGKLLLLSMVFVTLKAVAVSMALSPAAVLLVQPLQMLGYGLFTPSSVFFVNESVPAADRVRGQTIMMVASNGLGGMLAGLMGGRLLDLGGAALMLSVCVALGILSVLMAMAVLHWKHPVERA